MKKVYDMIVIGGGPGGYTAALYASRAGLDVLVLEKLSAGGQMALTHRIDNYPGFEDGIDGFELGEKMQRQAERFGAKTEYAEVQSVSLGGAEKEIKTDIGTFFAKTVVIATGANPRELGIPREQEMTGRGVGYCAACDGMFYKNKTVVVIGGGNSAAAEAAILSRIAARVIVVHRRDALRAEKASMKALENAQNVEFRLSSVAEALLGDDKISGVRIRNVISGEESEIACDGVFVSIGRNPATALFRDVLALDDGGYIIADESTKTNIDGVYAVGDVRTKVLRQVVTAVGDGAVAVHYAEEYLANL